MSRTFKALVLAALTLPAMAAENATPCFDAIYALKQDRLDDAITLYTRCIDEGDLARNNLIVAYNDRGNAYGKQGRYEEALQDFNRVIRLNPDDPDAWYNRGLTYRRLGNPEAALRDYTRAIELKPNYARAFNNRGNIHGRESRYEQAIADFDEAIALDADNAGAWFNRGLAHYSLGHYEKAVSDLQRAIELDPDYLKAYRHLAWLRATCPDAALRDGKAAVRLARKARFLAGQGNAALYDVLAAAYARAGQYDDAVRYQQLAIDTSTDATVLAPMKDRLNRYRTGESWQESGGNRFLAGG